MILIVYIWNNTFRKCKCCFVCAGFYTPNPHINLTLNQWFLKFGYLVYSYTIHKDLKFNSHRIFTINFWHAINVVNDESKKSCLNFCHNRSAQISINQSSFLAWLNAIWWETSFKGPWILFLTICSIIIVMPKITSQIIGFTNYWLLLALDLFSLLALCCY